jgi:heme o synthase
MDDLRKLTTPTTVGTDGLREWLTKLGEVSRALAQVFKLRIVFLLLISALGGAVLGAGGWPGGRAFWLLMLSGGLSAAGASALNQYLERERDRQMTRTRHRPLASGGTVSPTLVLALGIGMLISSVVLAAIFNPALAIFNGLGAAIYIGVYTLWLKPRTVLNIVIGGAAGSCAVLSGGAAAGAWNQPGVLALAALIFLWTPVHFWSLAMAYQKDYARTGFPMLPVHISGKRAAAWIALHTTGSSIIALGLAAHPKLSYLYLLTTLLASLQIIRLTYQLLRNPNPKIAYALFKFSNIYLGLLLLTAIIDIVI